ncbi:hypothetical protein [Bradyrhizobium sp. Ai1a-2]|uniref:hypothetical protein n=1 Tax=Bradyrhizobium sp. Ai1a-2 TaxID=196490 RepID=UPI00126929D5|nr:hypothetical protein [Bradyrhizobium sp. Ai1a-2]
MRRYEFWYRVQSRNREIALKDGINNSFLQEHIETKRQNSSLALCCWSASPADNAWEMNLKPLAFCATRPHIVAVR